MLNKIITLCAFCVFASTVRSDTFNLTNEAARLFLQPPDNVPSGYSENDEIRAQKECAARFAKKYGLDDKETVKLMCAALEGLLNKTKKTIEDQRLIGQGVGALKNMEDRFATNVLEKAIFTRDIKGQYFFVSCYFALAREDGIDAAYRMLAKRDIIEDYVRYAIYTDGIMPLLESKDEKVSKRAVALLHEAAKFEDFEDNATHLDRYLLKADPTWEKDEVRKRMADRFVQKGPILPYFREVQQKIGKPAADTGEK